MGHSHALTGCAAWLAISPIFGLAGAELSPGELLAGAIVCSGAALLPDLDHPQATIAHTYGPVTHLLARLVNHLSGGHRHATHSLAFAAFAGLVVEGVALLSERALLAVLFLLIGLGLRGVGIGIPGRRHPSALLNAVVTVGLLFALSRMSVHYWWIGAAVALGCLAHLAGDCLTPEGCPLLWPLGTRYEVAVIPHTGGPVERFVVTPMLVLAIIGMVRAEVPSWPLAETIKPAIGRLTEGPPPG